MVNIAAAFVVVNYAAGNAKAKRQAASKGALLFGSICECLCYPPRRKLIEGMGCKSYTQLHSYGYP